jgi:hypothetical protein
MRHATPRGLRRHVWPRRSGTPRTASTGRRGRRPPVSPRERGPAGGSSRNPARRDHDTPMSGTHRAMASGNLLWGYPTLAQSTPGLCRVADTPANVRPRGPHTSEPKPIKVLPDGAVTLARCTLERGAIQNRHVDTNAHASRQESVVRLVGLEEFDLQLCAGFLAALGEIPQVTAQVASKVHRGNGPRHDRWLHRPTGRALGRRRTTHGIAAILFEAKERGITHSSSHLGFQRRRCSSDPPKAGSDSEESRKRDSTTDRGRTVSLLTLRPSRNLTTTRDAQAARR